MRQTTIKQFRADYAGICRKVAAQEQALSPDAVATASVPDLTAANGDILADVRALRAKLEAAMVPLPDGRQILKHEYEALLQLASENGVKEEHVLGRLICAKMEGGQVKTIDLSSLGLVTIAPLDALTELVALNLCANALQGDPQFPALPTLQSLNLTTNGITGVSGLSHLAELTRLSLGNTVLKGNPQFPALPKLRILDLSLNKITGVLGLANLAELTELYLWGTAIKNEPRFPVLPKLRTLGLGSNQTPSVSGLAPLAGLKTLFVDANTKTRLGAQLKKLEEKGITVHEIY